MMRKAFLHLQVQLQKNEKDELWSTIKYLTKGSKTSSALSSFLNSKLNQDEDISSHNITKQEEKHVDTILKLLNATLPKKNLNEKRVQSHYNIFVKELQSVLTATNESITSVPTQKTVERKSKELYDKLILLQVTDRLTVNQYSKIILNKNFHHFDTLLENIVLFPLPRRLEIAILIFYKTGNLQIGKDYKLQFINEFSELHHSIQRIYWRCMLRANKNSIEGINEIIMQLKSWCNEDVIILYQSLFEFSHKLPMASNLAPNQELFIRVLRLLSEYKEYRSEIIRVVKLSIETKIHEVSLDIKKPISSQYKFATTLNLILHDIYKKLPPDRITLQDEIAKILQIINQEEKNLKSQISLKFV